MKKKIHYDVYIGVAMIALALFFLWGAILITVEVSSIVPLLYSYCLILLSALLIADGVGKSLKAAKGSGDPLPTVNLKESFWGLMTWAGIFLYYLMFRFLGFFPATVIFVVGAMLLLKQRNWKVILLTLAVLLGAIYLVFVKLLNVKLI